MPVGPTAFAMLVWGAIALVLVVFAYLLSVLVNEAVSGTGGHVE